MRSLVSIATLTLLSALPALAGGPEPCKIATQGDSPIAQACRAGGRPEARRAMKSLVKEARAKGQKLDCEGCHKNTDSFELKPGARDELEKLLAVAGKK